MKTSQKIYLPFKRLIGLFGSLIGIIVCFAFLWWWVLLINLFVTKGHPIFGQERVGKKGKTFKCLKFRTMRVDADPNMTSLSCSYSDCLTGFGKFLRVTSIDETIQLVNIFVGHMAFIGPRPLIYTGEDKVTIDKRKENGSINLKPGLSGYAQIHKRGKLNPLSKAEYDLYYYQHMSLWLDMKIFVYTILKLFGAAKGR